MSDALAIAAVTGLSRNILERIMKAPDPNLSSLVGWTVGASPLSPTSLGATQTGQMAAECFFVSGAA